MRFLKWFFITQVLNLFVWQGAAQSKIYLDFNSPSFRRLPVAVQLFRSRDPLSEAPGLGRELQETVSEDLDFSGLFRVLDPLSFIEDPKSSETDPTRIRFEDWRVIGAEALIKGSFSKTGDRLKAEFYLYDVIRRQVILGKRYYGRSEDLRRMAHKFSNRVIQEITGEPGVFDTRILYLSSSGGSYAIHRMDYDGHNDRILLRGKSILLSPKWSPDGEKVVFTSYRDQNPDLYQMVLETGRILKISGQPGINTGGTYSPGGGRLAYVMSKDGNSEIYILDKYSRRPKRITKNWATDVSPAWSPDGKRIAYMSDRGGSPQIYIMDRNGENIHRLTFQGKYNATPAWSPRGDRIVFSSLMNGHFQICTIKPDGTGMATITANAGDNETPSWSPDGRFICFSSTMNGKPDIYIMNANGSKLRRVTSGPARNLAPDWSPRLDPE